MPSARRERPPATPVPDPTWGDRVRALRYVPKLIKLVWNTHPPYTLIMTVLRVVRAFVPVASLWIGKLIIDRVVALRTTHDSATPLWHLVAAEIAIVFGGDLLSRASSLIESLLGDLFSIHTSIRLMEHAATLDLAQFEDPAFYDQLERARRQTVGRIGLLSELLTMGQDTLTLLTLGTALAVYSPWLLLLLAIAVLPSFLGETHFAGLEYSLLYRYTPERRQLDYLRYVGASDVTAKEVQMFGIAGWIVDRYRVLANRFYEDNKRLSIRKGILSSALSIFGTLGYYAAYVVILARTISGTITIGSLTFLAASFGRSRDIVQRLLSNASDISEQSLYLKDLFDFFEMKPTITTASGSRSIPSVIKEGFVFEDVGFRYPDSERWAVRHINFALKPGERIALVGENGAGKTTLTKLMPRLYDATEGRILLEGVDIRDYDLGELRRAVGVIFQDFVRFDMRFDENIGVGAIARGVAAAEVRGGVSPDAGTPLRGRCGAVGRGVAEDRARARVPARGAAADSRRADGSAGCARGVRGVPAILRAGRREDGSTHLASLLDGADGGSHHRAPGRWDRRGRDARGSRGARRALRGAVHAAGGGLPVVEF